MNLEKLKEPFAPSDVLWRIGQAGKNRQGYWAKVLAYIDSRCVQDRLDEVCGPDNWRNEKPEVGPGGGIVQGISIKINGEWVTKWDGAENSDIEAVKGGLSDSFKRAAVLWGIGRYLYDLGESWATIHENKVDGSHYANCKVKVDGKEEWVNFYWTPPKLPASAMPKATAAANLAASHGMTTGDKVQPPKAKGKAEQDTWAMAADLLDRATSIELVEAADRWIVKQGEKALFTKPQWAELGPRIAARAIQVCGTPEDFSKAEGLIRDAHKALRISEGDYLKICGQLEDAKDAKLGAAA